MSSNPRSLRCCEASSHTFLDLSVYTFHGKTGVGEAGRNQSRACSLEAGWRKPPGRTAWRRWAVEQGTKGRGGSRRCPDQDREEEGKAGESDSRKRGASLPPKGSPGGRSHQRAVLGGRWRRVSAWRSQHPSSKERQETTLGKRKRKPLGSGSSGCWARLGGAAGGGEEGLALSRVGPQPTPCSTRLPACHGLSTLMAPQEPQSASRLPRAHQAKGRTGPGTRDRALRGEALPRRQRSSGCGLQSPPQWLGAVRL